MNHGPKRISADVCIYPHKVRFSLSISDVRDIFLPQRTA